MRYVAFLGSINVGGNRLLMEDLRRVLRYEDFDNVETVVASGNVLFTHDESPSDGLAEKIAWTVREEFDIESFVAVRTRDELAAIIGENPFTDDGEDKFVHTMFLPEDPGEFAVKSLILDHEGRGPERIAAGTKAIHLDYSRGMADSKLTGDFIQRRLGLSGTSRNMRSMKRILAKMDEMDA